jgi:hypothetical protein
MVMNEKNRVLKSRRIIGGTARELRPSLWGKIHKRPHAAIFDMRRSIHL